MQNTVVEISQRLHYAKVSLLYSGNYRNYLFIEVAQLRGSHDFHAIVSPLWATPPEVINLTNAPPPPMQQK